MPDFCGCKSMLPEFTIRVCIHGADQKKGQSRGRRLGNKQLLRKSLQGVEFKHNGGLLLNVN